MKLTISYAELQEYVASHFHKTVNVGYVDEKTVSVSLPIKVLAFTKSVSINVGVEKIEGTDLYLSYDGKMGIDLLVSPAISYAKRLVPACVASHLLCQAARAGEGWMGGTAAWQHRETAPWRSRQAAEGV